MTFRDIFDAPLRGRLPARVTWTLEREALQQLHWARSLWEPTGPEWDVDDERLKRNHMVSICSSADGQLLAAVSSHGGVRVHEPGDRTGDSFRLSLQAPGASHAAWAAPDASGDALYVALAYRPTVWRFDLQSCGEDRPTRALTLPDRNSGSSGAVANSGRGHAVEVVPIAANTLAASASDGVVHLLDDRSKRPAIGAVTLQNAPVAPAIASHGSLLFVGSAGVVAAYDRRMLPRSGGAASGTTRTLGSGARVRQCTDVSGALTSARVAGSGAESAFASLRRVPTAPAGVVFQLHSGAVGYIDLLGCARARLEHEFAEPTRTGPDGELRSYGSAMRDNSGTWWVHRHRGCVVPTQNGAGWRFFAPLVHGKGFRTVAMRPNTTSEIVTVRTPRPVACVLAAEDGGGCLNITVGYASLKVDVFESKKPRKKQEKLDET